jgi:hypothetical protein
MIPPRATALRLVTRVRIKRAPPPPLGLRTWSIDADAVAVLLDASSLDADDPLQIAGQIPRAADLAPATPVFVLGRAVRSNGMLRWIGRQTIAVPRAARCTALVARGYVGVGASIDDASHTDIAWGLSSPDERL